MTENGKMEPREPLPPEKVRRFVQRLARDAEAGKILDYYPLSPGLIGANITAIETASGGNRLYRLMVLGYLFPGKWTDISEASSNRLSPYDWYAVDRWTGVWNDPLGEPGHKWPWHPALEEECAAILNAVYAEMDTAMEQVEHFGPREGVWYAAYDNGGEYYGTLMVLDEVEPEKWEVVEHFQCENPELDYPRLLEKVSKKYPALVVIERPNIFVDSAEEIVKRYLESNAPVQQEAF